MIVSEGCTKAIQSECRPTRVNNASVKSLPTRNMRLEHCQRRLMKTTGGIHRVSEYRLRCEPVDGDGGVDVGFVLAVGGEVMKTNLVLPMPILFPYPSCLFLPEK